MASDPRRSDVGQNASAGVTRPAGIVTRTGRTIGKSLVDTVLSTVWSSVLITPFMKFVLVPVAAYTGLWATEIAPSPAQLVERVRGGSAGQDTPRRSVGITEVKAHGDGASGALARALQVPVTERLRQMPDNFGGVRIQYALGPLTSGRGASSATSLRWALLADGTGWTYCPEIPLTFTSQQGLAVQIASQINNSLLASETTGELQCG